ncbi:MAG: ArsC/Spx/MgsR family protein [Pseudomonadota bacterium]
MIRIFGLKNCDTCRKALKSFAASKISVTFVDIREAPLNPGQIKSWIDDVGLETLVNKRSTTWRTLNDEEKASLAKDPVPLLLTHRTLIKRPVIENGDAVTAGWTEKLAKQFTG